MMTLPPKRRYFARVLYRVARFFFNDPLQGCDVATNVERVAAHRIRLRHHQHKQHGPGREHLLDLGKYEAGEIIRKHNISIAFDHLASQAIGVLFPKHDTVVTSWSPFRIKQKLPE